MVRINSTLGTFETEEVKVDDNVMARIVDDALQLGIDARDLRKGFATVRLDCPLTTKSYTWWNTEAGLFRGVAEPGQPYGQFQMVI